MDDLTISVGVRFWWDPVVLRGRDGVEWRIGPARVVAFRLPGEWQIAISPERRQTGGDDGGNAGWTVAAIEDFVPADEDVHRHVFGSPPSVVRLVPALADRPVVSRPTVPLYLSAGERTTLFVSSPLWAGVEVGEPGLRLQEFPLQRPSDTWFGSSTREGEICYASRTRAVLRLEDLPLRVHRAVTPVSLRNDGNDALLLERINLPVPNFQLFGDPATGQLWTQAVTMVRERGDGSASLQIHGGPPAAAGEAVLVAAPRIEPEKGILKRALGALLG